MSNRFYIDGFQPFSNNEIGLHTKEEITKQGLIWEDEGWILPKQEIKDIQTIMDAISKDVANIVNNSLGEKYQSIEPFTMNMVSKIQMDDIFTNEFAKGLYMDLFDVDGKFKKSCWLHLESSLYSSGPYILIPYLAYNHIKDKCDIILENNKKILKIKSDCKIWVEMY